MLRPTLLALALLCGSAQAQQTPPPPDCAGAEHRAFDFWIGEWDVVVTDTETPAGRSTITREDKGCVITEHWRSLRSDYTGRSLNLYDRATQHWEQFWADSTGDVTHFVGGPFQNGMRLVAEGDVGPGEPIPHFTRMTFSRNPDGSVRQHGENSADGAAWTSSYDFTYRRRAD